MTSSITLRLSDEDRTVLQAAAEAGGQGISTYLRRLAEGEARRIREQRTREQLDRVAATIAGDPEAAAGLEALSGDGVDWPEWTGPLPG